MSSRAQLWMKRAIMVFLGATILANLAMNIKTGSYRTRVDPCLIKIGAVQLSFANPKAYCPNSEEIDVTAHKYGFPFREKTVYVKDNGVAIWADCSGGPNRSRINPTTEKLDRDTSACPSRLGRQRIRPSLVLFFWIDWPNFWFYAFLLSFLYLGVVKFKERNI